MTKVRRGRARNRAASGGVEITEGNGRKGHLGWGRESDGRRNGIVGDGGKGNFRRKGASGVHVITDESHHWSF